MSFPSERAARPRDGRDSRPSSSRSFRDRNDRGGARGSRPSYDKRSSAGRGERRKDLVIPAVDPSQHSAAFAALGVPPRLLDALVHAGIDAPFPVQSASLPDALAGRDVLGRAPTGSGKTLAYGLALLARCEKAQPRAPKALILVPTRELAKQVAQVLVPYARATDRWVTAFFGGAGLHVQIADLQRGVDIAVATPGRLLDLINRGDCRLDDVELLVIDEADRMADMGFTPQVRELMDQVNEKRQILFFSATLDGDVDDLVKRYLHDPVVHELGGSDDDETAALRAEHVVVMTKHERKFQDLADLLGDVKRAIVFVKNRFATERVAEALEQLGVTAFAMHGGMTQNAREGSLKRWAQGEKVALVATDVAARGVHVAGVEVVVHLDPPQDEKDYIHRSGRTARAGESGLVVNLFRKEQLRPAAAMHRRLNVAATTMEMAAAKDLLVNLATERRSGVTAVPADAAAPVAGHEIWTTAELSEFDEEVDGSANGSAPSRRDDGRARGRRFDGDARPAFGDRDRGPRPSFGERPSYGDRPAYGERPSYGDRPAYGERGPRPSFGDRDRGPRGGFGDRERGARPSFGDRDRGSRPSFGDRDRGPRGGFGDRDRGARPAFGERDRSRDAGARSFDDRGRGAKPDRDRPWSPAGPAGRPDRDRSDRPARPAYGADRGGRFDGGARPSWRDGAPQRDEQGPRPSWRDGRPARPEGQDRSRAPWSADARPRRSDDHGGGHRPYREDVGGRWSSAPRGDRDRTRPGDDRAAWSSRSGAARPDSRGTAPGRRSDGPRPWSAHRPDGPARRRPDDHAGARRVGRSDS